MGAKNKTQGEFKQNSWNARDYWLSTNWAVYSIEAPWINGLIEAFDGQLKNYLFFVPSLKLILLVSESLVDHIACAVNTL